MGHYYMAVMAQATQNSAARNGVRSNCLLVTRLRWFMALIRRYAMNLEEVVNQFEICLVAHLFS